MLTDETARAFAERYGPWALITGASEGTGAAFARRIAAMGIGIILVARREGPLSDLATALRGEGGEVHIVAADLAAPDAAGRIVAGIGDREVGLLVANAGSDANGAEFLDREVDAWDRLIYLNVLTTMRLCHALGGAMRARRRGGLLLVGSGACYGGAGNMAVYAGSKAFVLGFSEGLWAELRHDGVDVLNLILSRTDTPALRTLLEEKGLPVPAGLADPDAVARLGLERLPFGPVQHWGAADDEPGFAPMPAAARRERVIATDRASRSVFGERRA